MGWDPRARLEERLAKDKLSLLLLRKFGSSERAIEGRRGDDGSGKTLAQRESGREEGPMPG